ncbi:glutaredoxin family protein [Halosegnis marinus]|uniref:Glutaredoxin family protein n=1 Tax=Halosegnis marinus TaxID=3034023 RepID=A0ABD5ZMW7_9EURY|nr:glutaredoxin domain-containing protein [Halosegnis sp. DT85]
MSEPVTLYRLQGCPFCERVVRSLQDHGVEYESRFVEARHSRRDAVKRVSGSRTVPAVVDPNTGVTMSESANIVEYVEGTYGQREGEKVRTDGGTRERGGE